MKAPYRPKPALESLISSHLNVEAYALKELARWCRAAWPSSSRAREFKEQLRNAINTPGLITPEMYEKWTSDDKLETQEAVNMRLKDLWNACFPAESIT
ncbi:hypothetical protein [Prosthecobacter sp.]|uniref:hypothetical protein n=1 Tax=Prosthecobacter sp. TaxID=1965333 RepID=UPI0024877500|nr:hypothetical protein [Prosthecobacter sp.]MDI1313283.1 hypothetical protein [Prosthecobacter sp.]